MGSKLLDSHEKRPTYPPIIQALETEMMRPILSSERFRDVSKVMNTLTYWAERERSNHRLCKLFRGLVQGAKLYAGKVSNFTVKANLLGYVFLTAILMSVDLPICTCVAMLSGWS